MLHLELYSSQKSPVQLKPGSQNAPLGDTVTVSDDKSFAIT